MYHGLKRYNIEVPIVTTGDGLYESDTEPGRLIYRGTNPNNYIWLDENGDGISNIDENDKKTELYRIVSYEADGTIKVVKNECLASKWDKGRTSDNNTYCTNEINGCNAWGSGATTLYNGTPLGNNFYYSYYTNATTTTLTKGESGAVTAESTMNQYLNSKILNSEDSWQPAITLDNYIENHSWNVGGIYYTKEYEDGDKGLAREKEEEQQLKWIGKISLLNITEFVEASTNSECTSVYSNYRFNYPNYYYQGEGESQKTEHAPEDYPCEINNWTYKTYNQWTLTPSLDGTNSYNVWFIRQYFSPFKASGAQRFNPAFYLKANLNLNGSGEEDDEYKIQ